MELSNLPKGFRWARVRFPFRGRGIFSGVYLAIYKDTVVYVGMSNNLFQRLKSHFHTPWFQLLDPRPLIFWARTSNPEVDEAQLIEQLRPTINVLSKEKKRSSYRKLMRRFRLR